jgi:hypothetical protein
LSRCSAVDIAEAASRGSQLCAPSSSAVSSSVIQLRQLFGSACTAAAASSAGRGTATAAAAASRGGGWQAVSAAAAAARHQQSRGYARFLQFPQRGGGSRWGGEWDSDKVLWSLIAANIGGFALWRIAPTLVRSIRPCLFGRIDWHRVCCRTGVPMSCHWQRITQALRCNLSGRLPAEPMVLGLPLQT